MYHVKLSKSDTELFKIMGGIIPGEGVEPDIFYLPQYFKHLGNDVYEVLSFDELPEDVKELIEANRFIKETRTTIADKCDGLMPEIRKQP